MLSKEDTKTILIITFVIVELASLLFNSFFVHVNIGSYSFNLNYSIVFFCIGFFIVDIINDFFSSKESCKFFYYKLYAQLLFLFLSYSAIYVYQLENTMIEKMIGESPWAIFSGLVAAKIGFKIMNKIMDKIKVNTYEGYSAFWRYMCSTLPGEIVFSLVYSILCFSPGRDFSEVLHIFSISCMAKIVLSTIFSLIMSVLLKFKNPNFIKNTAYLNQIERTD